MNEKVVELAIETGIELEQMRMLSYLMEDALVEGSEEYTIADQTCDRIENLREKMIQILCEYYDISENDFVGDGFAITFDEAFSGEYDVEGAKKMLNSIENEKEELRVSVIMNNLRLLREYDEKIRKGIDIEYSKHIFSVRLNILLEQPNVPLDKKEYFTKIILKHVRGEIEEHEILNEYAFYIFR